MKEIKFSADYEKLPLFWEGTHAMLVAVTPINIDFIKNGLTAFWKYDTKYRNKDSFYDLNFDDESIIKGLILVFIHYNTGIPFTTIRRNYKEKFEYYINAVGETFKLVRT